MSFGHSSSLQRVLVCFGSFDVQRAGMQRVQLCSLNLGKGQDTFEGGENKEGLACSGRKQNGRVAGLRPLCVDDGDGKGWGMIVVCQGMNGDDDPRIV